MARTTGTTGKTTETRTKAAVEKAPAKPRTTAKPAATGEAAAPATRSRSKSAEAVKTAVQLSPEDRNRCVAEAAYFIAERRGFPGGTESEDWLQAEAQIDAMLAGDTRH